MRINMEIIVECFFHNCVIKFILLSSIQANNKQHENAFILNEKATMIIRIIIHDKALIKDAFT